MFKKTTIARATCTLASSTALLATLPTSAQDLQRVEITGSLIKRVDAEGALPVTVVTKEEIIRSGVVSTEQLLQSLSAVSSQGSTLGATGAGSSTAGQSTVSLRGLFARRTLVLVNGRRLAASFNGAAASAATNINTIPLSAIERVEVLKDGASSIYGSDALAGVVNFILAKDFQGIDIGVLSNQPTRSGGGDSQRATITAGFGNFAKDNFNVTLSASFEKERQLFAKDRSFAASGNQFPYIVAGATGQGNIEGFFVPGRRDAAGNWVFGTRVAGFGNSPGAGYGNPLAATNRCADINMFANPTPTSKGDPYCTFDSSAFVGLVPEREATSFTLNGAFQVNSKLELFADGYFATSDSTQRFQPSPVRRSFLTPTADDGFRAAGIDPALLLLPTNPNYAVATAYLRSRGYGALVDANAGNPLAVTARVFDFGPRTSLDKNEQTRLVVGAKGEIAGQSYEVALMDSKYKLSGTVPDGYFSQTAYARAINGSNEWNPWSLTLSDGFKQAIAPAKYTGATLDGTSKLSSIDGKVSGDIFNLPGGPLSYAVGAQFRKEAIVTRPSAALFSGDIAGLGGATPPIDRSREIKSFFAEVVAPVIKGLELNGAVRQDRYNDVGKADTYKVSARYQPTKQLLVRASTGTGFRAPLLGELWLPQTIGTSEQFTDPAFPNNPNLQVPALSGGNPALKPEKSKQTTVGIVFQPINSVTAAIDYWTMDVRDMITSPSTQEIVSRFRAGDPAYANLVTLTATREVDQVRAILANVGSAKLSGVDVDVSGRFPMAGGRVDVGLAGTYMIKFDQASPSGAISKKVGTLVEANGDPVINADEGGVILRWKHRLSATYTRGAWGVTLAQNFYTGYRTGNRQIDGEPHSVPDQALYDMFVSYTGIKNLRLGLGVKNLFDKNPPIFVPVSNQFQAGYDITQYDPRGRMLTLAANYKF